MIQNKIVKSVKNLREILIKIEDIDDEDIDPIDEICFGIEERGIAYKDEIVDVIKDIQQNMMLNGIITEGDTTFEQIEITISDIKNSEIPNQNKIPKKGFPAVIKRLNGDASRGNLHLSSSEGSRYYISHYFSYGKKRELEELKKWFGEELAKEIVKLEEGEGLHCYLMPALAKLSPLEKQQIEEHDCDKLVTIDELYKR